MKFDRFAISLAERVHDLAVRENAHANEAYAQALNGYAYVGGRVLGNEDEAWAECKRTAVLADFALEALEEVEDQIR